MQNKKIIKDAIEVINTEISAVKQLSKKINKNFSDSIIALSKTKGRVIITGIGKSGHIASKIASTMSSTGTPAQFCHSTEMSHGDLGVIDKKDILIIISNSGNSSELIDVIHFAKKNSVQTIGISSNAESELMKLATYPIILPKVNEACAIGMAPTSSTTITLVLGDAICVALMKLKKFNVENYRNIHPGGSLGTSLLKVSNIMHKSKRIPIVQEESKMKDVIVEITKKALGHVGVLNKSHQLVGIITDGDLRRHLNGKFLEKKAKEIMTKKPKMIFDDELMLSALHVMNQNKITCLFISNKLLPKKPIGIIHIHDCLRFSQ